MDRLAPVWLQRFSFVTAEAVLAPLDRRGGEMAKNARLDRLNLAWWTLRIGLGVGPCLAGLDKFFNRLTNWDMYLSPAIPQILHVAPAMFMHVVGVIEMIAGILIL